MRNWYSIAKFAEQLPLVYRVCVLRNNPTTGHQEIRSLYPQRPPQWIPIAIGQPIQAVVHVGTHS